MDLQKMVNAQVAAERSARLSQSDQMTLGELIATLKPLLKNQKEIEEKYGHKTHVNFDFSNTYPTGLTSWRGSYSELALNWAGGHYDDEFDRMEIDKFIEMLEEALGKTFDGWKGGDFVMGKTTPLWVANDGLSGETGVIGVRDEEYSVVLITGYCKY